MPRRLSGWRRVHSGKDAHRRDAVAAALEAEGYARHCDSSRACCPTPRFYTIELCAESDEIGDASARFGVSADATLRPAYAPALGLSSPSRLIVLRVGELPQTATPVIQLLHTSTTLNGVRQHGLHLETYSNTTINATETELHIEKLGTPGRFERNTVALGGERRPIAGARVRLTDTRVGTPLDAARSTNAFRRAVEVNIGALRPGDGAVTVTVRTNDGRGASTDRLFTVAAAKGVER